MEKRETFASRLGFLLISAGCAIGIGNVWRFPYITGRYGGAAFVLIYLFFLIVLGLPIMVMEFSVGRASRKSCAQSFRVLEPAGSKWHHYAWFGMAGNYLLMMFYTTEGGWMLAYVFKMLRGDFVSAGTAAVEEQFNQFLSAPGPQLGWMAVTVFIGFFICSLGLRGGVEKITKWLMIFLLGLMVILAVRSITLPNAAEGLKFYLIPDFSRVAEQGVFNVIYAAMGQAFFTLSLGIGAMAIFGSYIGKEHTLMSESVRIMVLDTFVALMAGLIIFPACFSYQVSPDQGTGLVFVTLPNIFGEMPGGRFWGALFCLFLFFAAISTIIAVFENIVSFGIDLMNWSRKKSVVVNLAAILLLSVPCVLGFNLWSGFHPLGGATNIMDLEDFLVSGNLLPLGSLIYLLFCTSRYGWGWKSFYQEANEGSGMKLPGWCRRYVTYILPLIILFIFVMGYKDKFF